MIVSLDALLIRLSRLISSHPHWAERGWSMAGRVELVARPA
ncbi:hypothetical protein ACFV8T_44795 [Streptomyces sp. NPDC059832]